MLLISTEQQRSKEYLPSSEEYLPPSAVQRQNLLDVLDRILDKGIVINGEITVSLLKTEILSLRINLVIASIETAKRYGLELPWEKWQDSSKRLQVRDNNNSNKNKNKNKNKRILQKQEIG